MEMENEQKLVVNPEQCKELFNAVLEQNANGNSAFNENDTNFSQSIDTSTVSIKEQNANSLFVGEDSFLETKIKIEEHDLYHNATHLFDKTTFDYNKDIRSKHVNDAKEFQNFSNDGFKQSREIDSTSISSAANDDDCNESINWELDVVNNTKFVNLNENHVLNEVSLSNDNESNSSEISEKKLKLLKRSTERQSVIILLNNIKMSNFKDIVVEKRSQKQTSAELLGTTEDLYVYLQQQDLYELQRTFRRNKSQSKESEKGLRRQRNNAHRPKIFSCRLCYFKSDTKYQRAVHIVENHKEVAKAKNMVETQCMAPGSSPDEILYKCKECSYITNFMASFNHHLLSHKSVDELEQTFRCASCPFVAKCKSLLISHVLVHIPPERQHLHECPHCDFRAKRKVYIRRHIQRMHNSKLQTKYGAYFHKREGRYKCTQCPYQTNSSYIFKKFHSLKHTSDEVKVHACLLCSYKGKRKDSLKQHMLIHKTPDEVIYKCDLCPYSNNRKYNLLRHQGRVHAEVSEKDKIPCSLCPFKSRYRSVVKSHMLTHKKKEELPMFQCDHCEFKTTVKHYIRQHCMLKHTDPSEIDWKRCDKCNYKTKLQCQLKKHSIIHKKPEDVEMFSCAQCSYSTKWKPLLKEHMAMHTNFYYNCPVCSFKTKHSSSLYHHKKKHSLKKISRHR